MQADGKKAEAVEREATALMQKVLDACPVPTRMSTIEGETLYRNPASRELYGDRAYIDDYYVNPDDRKMLVKVLLDKGCIDDFRVRQYDVNGNVFWGSISARLIEFQGRAVIVSNATNITDIINAQDQARQASERLADGIESLAEGFALYDKDDRLVLANSQYRKMHSVSADALVPGVNWFDFLRVAAQRNQFPVSSDSIDDWLIERAKDRREFRQQEFRHSDGGWFFVSNCPTREGGFVVTRVDITERKRSELAAKEADELVRKVLEACPASIQMTRVSDGKMLYRSPATEQLHGEVDSAFDSYLNPLHRKQFVEHLLREGAIDDFETQLRRKDGQPCWCSISARLIDFHGEKVIVSHTYDLSDRIDMQQQLERQRETLHQNEKLSALGGLLAGVAHELNNPLSVVLGMSLTLKETASDPKTVERADKISKAAERCARIVRTFLAMARQQPTRTSNVSIDDIVMAATEVVGYSIKSSDIKLSLRLDADLPAVWADPDQLSQVLINLLVNAEHALHGWDGERQITVSTHRHPESGNIVVKVADTGPGIPDEILPRIFEPFFTTKDVGAGTGIGLSFCHRIVQSHQGTIRVETTRGGGSTFVISLPASDRIVERAESVTTEPSKSTGRVCLVVEDEKDVGELIAEILTQDGFSVIVARSGKEALMQLKLRTFDIILCDLRMPDMDGRRLFNHVSDFHPAEAERLAFLTGDTISPDAQVFLRATKRPYLEKPVKPFELRTFVSRLVNRDG
ncbi:ATP-binding protein [Aminobacter sp. AP02]|uniref:hybrid sensor histidine kinase/response regulator n=1 Tax=Aminobacter sp. AP02 TaxID=2135737 RepID=UPI000D6D7904|nr:ATP-binding protein [Aminobacter sp. AP02]PWK65845.1 PAS domain-containing protein [Aminobacter sp. AP02]